MASALRVWAPQPKDRLTIGPQAASLPHKPRQQWIGYFLTIPKPLIALPPGDDHARSGGRSRTAPSQRWPYKPRSCTPSTALHRSSAAPFHRGTAQILKLSSQPDEHAYGGGSLRGRDDVERRGRLIGRDESGKAAEGHRGNASRDQRDTAANQVDRGS